MVFEELFKEDTLEPVLEHLMLVAKTCLTPLVKTLLVWKATMCNPAQSKKMTHSEERYQERYQLAIDYNFTVTVYALLKHGYNDNPLEDAESLQLEKVR